jgi:hypothetical protein
MAAVSSMRWFVVCDWAPLTTRSPPSSRISAAQPPGPGLPEQAPSV